MINEHLDEMNAVSEEMEQQTTEQENLQEQITLLQEQIEQTQDKYARLYADFDNYQKRMEKEQIQWISNAQGKVLKDILPMVDNVMRALEQKTPETAATFAGIEMVLQSLLQMLAKYGVTEFSSYDVFDPEFHEALTQVPSPEHASGTIIQVFEKGFMMHGKVLRPAKVIVAQ